MKQTTVRMHMNPEEALGTINHVLEKEFRDREAHVNPQGEFEVWVNKGVYGVYKEVFGEVIEEYNRKQKRKDRRITDAEGDEITGYIKSIKNSKRGKRKKVVEKKLDDGTIQKIEVESDNGQRILYELVVSAGNCNKLMDERGRVVYTDDGYEIHPYRMEREVNKRALKRFCREFENAYPNLKIAAAAYHADEQYLNGKGNYEWGIEHMHLNFIPVASGYTRGLSVQASISKALEQMGFKNGTDSDGIYRNAYWQFCDDAQKRFEYILNVEYILYCAENKLKPEELEILHPVRGTGKKNLDPDVYKTLKELENRKLSVNADLVEIQEQKQVVEEEVVEAKKRLKKANTEAEDVLLDTFAEADERLAEVEADLLQKQMEMDEVEVSMKVETMIADAKMQDANNYFDDIVQNAKNMETVAKDYIEQCYKEYDGDFDKCKVALATIKKDIKKLQNELERTEQEDLQVDVDAELKQYLLTHFIVVNDTEVSLLDDFTEQVEKKKRRRNGTVENITHKLQRQVTDRLEGIDDYQKFLQMRCCDGNTEELER